MSITILREITGVNFLIIYITLDTYIKIIILYLFKMKLVKERRKDVFILNMECSNNKRYKSS